MALGYIYVLSNPTMGSLLKIGFTSASVERRASELSSATGVPTPFVIEYFHITDDVEQVETLVHSTLPRHTDNREFFATSIDEAIAVILRYVKPPLMQFQKPAPAPVVEVQPTTSCRRCGFSYVRSETERFCPSCGF